MNTKTDLPAGDFTPVNYSLPVSQRRLSLKRVIRRYCYPLYNSLTTCILRKKYQTSDFMPDLWLWGQRGNDYERHRRRVAKHIPFKNKKVLIAGCGTAKDVISWAVYGPEVIIGVDLFSYDKAWELWGCYLKKFAPQTTVEFIQADLARIPQLEDGCIDVIGSDAVFEHLKNLQEVLKEFYRILKPGGVLYATFGPLWYGYGGDHVSGYDQILSGYNHLILDPPEYRMYLEGMGEQRHSEDDGRTWIQHDLFSRLKPSEYLLLIEAAGFKRMFVSAIVDPRAVRCIGDPKFDRLKVSNLDELDLVVSGMTIIYQK